MLIKQSYVHWPDGGSVTTFFTIICKPPIMETQLFFFFSSLDSRDSYHDF